MKEHTKFDELMAELERDHPEEMEEARIWAKDFIERWKEDPNLVEITEITVLDAQTALDMLDNPKPPTEELIELMRLK